MIGEFWGDQSETSARKCLNTALWRLRSILEPSEIPRGTYVLSTDVGEVGFNWDCIYWLDTEVFEQKIAPALRLPVTEAQPESIQIIEQSIALYQGDFLEGLYTNWALRERERLRRIYLGSLTYLVHYYAHNQKTDISIQYAQQILDLEPLYEKIHRELMELYMQNGQRALAIQQYETCCQWLEQELDVPPMEETEALYNQIIAQTQPCTFQLRASQSRIPQSIRVSGSTLYQEALDELKLATHQFDEARMRLARATQLVENAMRTITI